MRKIRDLSKGNPVPAKIRKEYFDWLCEVVNIGTPEHPNVKLAKMLHEREFTWFIPNDDNREVDGIHLRDIFILETSCVKPEYLKGPCSVLEMLIALAIRIEGVLEDPRKRNRTAVWFWEMIRNLELEKYTDEVLETQEGSDERVQEVVDRLLGRYYHANGEGGLFPLRRPKEDQRKLEIWYQMMAYLDENHSV